MLKKDKTEARTPDERRARWQEHFQELLNDGVAVNAPPLPQQVQASDASRKPLRG